MIWRDRLNFTAPPTTVEIVDEDDWTTRFDGEVARTLPKLRDIRVKFRFDGVLEIWRNGALTERRKLKAKKASDDVASTVVKDVDWETTLKIWTSMIAFERCVLNAAPTPRRNFGVETGETRKGGEEENEKRGDASRKSRRNVCGRRNAFKGKI